MAGANKSYRFKPSVLPTLAAAALMGVLIALGIWQLNRAQEKRAMLLQFETLNRAPPVELRLPVAHPAVWRYRHVKVTGHFDSDRQFLLDNQVSRSQVGYHVITPLRLLQNQKYVLVDRGWIPLGASRETLPNIPLTNGKVIVEGTVYVPYGQGYSLGGMAAGEHDWPLRVQFINFKQMAARLGAPVAAMIIRLDPKSPDGYRREWQVVPFGPARHIGYAVQWFALACALLIFYFVVNFKRVR